MISRPSKIVLTLSNAQLLPPEQIRRVYCVRIKYLTEHDTRVRIMYSSWGASNGSRETNSTDNDVRLGVVSCGTFNGCLSVNTGRGTRGR